MFPSLAEISVGADWSPEKSVGVEHWRCARGCMYACDVRAGVCARIACVHVYVRVLEHVRMSCAYGDTARVACV